MNGITFQKILMPALACITFISCSERIDGLGTEENEELSIIVSSAPASRTVFSDTDRRTLWSKDDILFVYDNEQICRPFSAVIGSEEYAQQMKFTCKTWPKGKAPMWVAYNGKDTEDDFSDRAAGKFTTEIPSVQTTFREGSFGEGAAVMAGKATPAEEGGYAVEMKNLCGLVRFEIANAQPDLSAITLSDADGKDIAGTVEVEWADGDPVCSISEGKKNITFRRAEGSRDGSQSGHIGDGAYYFCLPGGVDIIPVVTFTLASGKQAAYRHSENVHIDRNCIADLGVVDGTVEFDKPYVIKFDFLNWSESVISPTGSEIDAKSKIKEFYGKKGILIESSVPLGRSSAYGLYSYSEVTAGSCITLPAVPGMRLSKVYADLGGMPSKGYPNNSGAPFIADASGNTLKGGEPASSYSFVIPEQGESEPDSDPYVWTLAESEPETSYLLKFTESVASFGMQSLTLYYTGEEEPVDISGVTTESGESSATKQITMTGSFTTDNGMYNGTYYGFRYKASTDDSWTYISADEHNGGRFSTTVNVESSGDYIFCAYAGKGEKSCLRRFGAPKTVHVAGEFITLETVDFTASDAIPEQSGATADETVITSSDGYVYKVSGQVFEDVGKVTYYRHSTEKSLYFARANAGGTVDNNACGFIELPCPEGCTLKSIDINDSKSTKTYRVYSGKKSIYEASDKSHLGSVTNVKTEPKVTLTVSGAKSGETYYLCCPIFSYVNSISLTYEK